ncbi:MAG: DUF2007 domain-containing protein [Pseudomonadota bacterium]
MKRVFIAKHPTEAYMVKSLLETEGIASEVRGEALFGALGELPITEETLPSVWISEDSQLERAIDFIKRYQKGQGPPEACGLSWKCIKCGEIIEPQFTSCWRCGTDRKTGNA